MDTTYQAFFEGSETNISLLIYMLLIGQVHFKKDNLSSSLSLAFCMKMLFIIERYICTLDSKKMFYKEIIWR